MGFGCQVSGVRKNIHLHHHTLPFSQLTAKAEIKHFSKVSFSQTLYFSPDT